MKKALEKASIEYSDAPEDLLSYSFDASRLKGSPSLVVWPKSTEDVVFIMKNAYERGIPVVPRGSGTATTGGGSATKGAVVLSFEKMQKLLEIIPESQVVVVEPGMINGQLQRELLPYNLFYPPDPASLEFCSLGGNVATNAGGPRAIKYGVTRDYVLEIEAVTSDGQVIRAGSKTLKATVGYDLKDLLIGSEGTLAVFTKLTLRVLPEPEKTVGLMVLLDRLELAGQVVTEVLAEGILPRTMELIDRSALEAVENYKPTGLPLAEAMLLIELDGSSKEVEETTEKLSEICQEYTKDIRIASDSISRERLWLARRSIAPAIHRYGSEKINHDIVVPRHKLTEMLLFLRNCSEKTGLKIVTFGHAGDGNLHVNIMHQVDERQKAEALAIDILKKTVSLGGVISGEHGIGIKKVPFVQMQLRQKEIDLMKGIKKLFDHKGILNPGKVLG
ncbi:MAG: FAD-binding protein [Nitrospirae bacterium]|nr:MAG: FAD-binding protein [Nitrospirota bacterium]